MRKSHKEYASTERIQVSVIIPIYNIESYIGECINSVTKQSYANLEIILVDDGSQDASPEICDHYARVDRRIKVIHKENGGLSSARNCGLRCATGEYLLFLDGDDYWDDEHALRRGVDIIEHMGQVDILMFGYRQIYANAQRATAPIDISKINECSKVEALTYLISTDCLIVTAWSKFVRRGLLIDNDITFKEGLLSEDYDWNFSILTNAQTIRAMSGEFYCYRTRGGSITSRISTKHLFDILSIIEDWSTRIPIQAKSPAEVELFMGFVAFIYGMLFSRVYLARPKQLRCTLLERIYAQRHLLEYRLSPKLRRVWQLYKLLGFALTWRVLGVVSQLRGLITSLFLRPL